MTAYIGPDLEAQLASLQAAQARGPQFLDGLFSVDTLPAPSAANVNQYARVTDLFGAKRDVVICTLFTVAGSPVYRWEPLRPDFAQSMAPTDNMTLDGLKSPPTLLFAGNLAKNITVTLDPARAWPGRFQEIAYDGVVGLFSLNLSIPGFGSVFSMLNGGRRRFVYDGVSYKQVA